MLTLIDRHIGRSIIQGTLLVLAVFAALFVFASLIDELPNYGSGHFGAYEIVSFVLLSQPRKLYEIFPVTVLIGTLLGLSTLALNSELIAMRAAGMSKARIIGAAMKTGAVLVIGAVLVGEYVVPVAETQAQTGRAQALATSLQHGSGGLWLRDRNSFVSIGEVLPDLSLLRVDIYELTPTYEMHRHIYADRARYDGKEWQLLDVHASDIGQQQIVTHIQAQMPWPAALTPDVVAVFTIRPEALSIAQLHAYIKHLRHNNQEVARYMLAFWQKCFMPLATALMMFLAVPFVFRSARSGGLAQRMFLGIVLGLVFVVVHKALGYIAVIYGLPPLFAAVAPLILFLVLALILVRRLA